jgi:hypothetical protein
MYKQLENFRTTVAADRNDTYKVDLPKAGILSFIYLDLLAQQTGTTPFQNVGTGKWRLLDYLTNISVVVNGRASVVSVPADLLQYRAYLAQGITAFNKEREYSNSSQNCRIVIPFGDWMWDKSKGLDMADYDNVELQIKNECATTQWADGNKVTVKLGWMRDHTLPVSKEFYQYELWRSLTTVADKWEYLSLPTGKKIKNIVIQTKSGRNSTTGIDTDYARNVLDEIKLQFKNGQTIVFDDSIEKLWQLNWLDLGFENFVHGAIYHFASRGFDVGIGEVRGAAALAHASGTTVASIIPSREGDQDRTTQQFMSYSADHPTDFLFRGAGYHSCGVFRFGEYGQSEDLLDPSKSGVGDVLLDLHTYNSSDSAGGTNKVALERVATPASLAA